MSQFDYTPLRNTAIALVKKFGRHVPCVLLRAQEGSPPDASKPWRRNDPTVYQFEFLGVVSTIGFPKRSDPVVDQDQDVIAPGDLATTAANGFPLVLCGKPLDTDQIQAGDLKMRIIGVQDITPDADAFIYKMRCRAWPLLMPTGGTIG